MEGRKGKGKEGGIMERNKGRWKERRMGEKVKGRRRRIIGGMKGEKEKNNGREERGKGEE